MVSGLRSALFRYGLAVLVFVALIALASVLKVYSIKVNLAIPIVLSLVIAAWYGGRGPGLLVAVLIQMVSVFSTPPPPDETVATTAF